MKTCDWNELKDGDIFRVPNARYEWSERLNFWPGANRVWKRKSGRLYQLGHTAYSAWYRQYTYATHKAQVEVFENEAEVPAHYIVSTNQSRVNGTTGSDPEIFVIKGGGEQKSLLPAFRFLPTQKVAQEAHPQKLDFSFHTTNPAYAYRDGFAAECFVQPVSCHGYFVDFLRKALLKVRDAAQNFDRTAKLTIKNTVTIPKSVMESIEDEDAALGCMPSLNAYGDQPDLPTDGRKFLQRFVGGHVHLGIAADVAEKDAENIVKGCDIIAGIPAVAIFASIDTPARRKYYGRAGEYRLPKHGIEYRTLSNAWLAAPEVAHLMLNLVRCGAKVGKHGFLKYMNITEDKAREIINSCDVQEARKYVMGNLPIFTTLLTGDGSTSGTDDRGFKAIIEGGVEAVIPTFDNLDLNWKLDSNWANHSDALNKSWSSFCSSLPKTLPMNT